MMVNIEFESLGRGACTMAASSIYQIFWTILVHHGVHLEAFNEDKGVEGAEPAAALAPSS